MITDIAIFCYIAFIIGLGSSVFYFNAAHLIINFPVTNKSKIKILYLTKIIFNFTGGIKLNFDMIYYMLSPNITYNICKTISLMNALVILIYRTSLIICLFCKVKVICDKNERLLSGLLLMLITIGFQIANIALLKPEIEKTKCKPNIFKNLITTWGFVITDFVIELYFAFKVIIIMNIAKSKRKYSFQCTGIENSTHLSCDLRKFTSSETYRVFNAVIFWFSIRILMAVLLNVVTAINVGIISDLHITIIPTLNILFCIAMSFLLTYSKDIVSYLSLRK